MAGRIDSEHAPARRPRRQSPPRLHSRPRPVMKRERASTLTRRVPSGSPVAASWIEVTARARPLVGPVSDPSGAEQTSHPQPAPRVPLCWQHHRAYDTGRVELFPPRAAVAGRDRARSEPPRADRDGAAAGPAAALRSRAEPRSLEADQRTTPERTGRRSTVGVRLRLRSGRRRALHSRSLERSDVQNARRRPPV